MVGPHVGGAAIGSIACANNPEDLDENDLVWFDYNHSGRGLTTRCGYVLEVDSDSLLLHDLSVSGEYRRFKLDYIENLTLLEERAK